MLKEGQYFEEEIIFDQTQVEKFGEISGDVNPVHFDDVAANLAGFEKRIIHGFLSGSIFSKIIGIDFPGLGSIYLKQSLSFRGPMFVGEEYIAKVKVLSVNEEKMSYHLETSLRKKNDAQIVIQGDALVINRSSFKK